MFKIKKRLASLAIIFACLLAWLGNMPAAAQDEFDMLRIKRFDLITGGSTYDVNNNEIKSKIQGINSYAQKSWNDMDKSPNRTYLWSVFASTTNSSHIVESYNKLLQMATAYRTRGAALYGNQNLKNDILGALEWMYQNRFNENTEWYDNWWSWDIGAPMALTDICILMYDDFNSPSDMERYLRPVNKFCGDPVHYYHYPKGVTSGANRTWKCINLAKYGILMKNSNAITLARDSMDDAFQYVTSGDGFYADGSFIQHLAMPSSGGYGVNHFTDTLNMVYLLGGSQWAFSADKMQRIYEWTFNAFEPQIFRGAMLSAAYEALTQHGNRVISALLLLGDLATGAEKQRIKSMAKAMIIEDTNYFASCTTIFAVHEGARLLADSTVTPRVNYNIYKQYPNMDRVVKRGEGYAFTVNMHSTRIYNYESVNDNNLKGWHTGDGMTSLFDADTNQYYGGYWPTVDNYRLPGTTVNKGQTMTHQTKGRSPWAGGTDMDDTYGVSGMVLAPGEITLSANKSWFMFDNEIVALGSGITSNDGYVVETVVDNRKLNGSGNNAFYVNNTLKSTSTSWSETLNLTAGSWAHLKGNVTGADIGYYFPESAVVNAKRESRTGRWSEIKSGGSSTAITNRFLTMWIDHGTNAGVSSGYAYTILPGMSAVETGAYAQNPDIEIMENSTKAHAVYEKNLKILGATFWQAGAVNAFGKADYLKSDGYAAVMVKKEEAGISISVADPTHRQSGSLRIELDEAADGVIAKDAEVTVISTSPKIVISVAVGGKHGQSFKVSFSKSGGGIRFEDEGGVELLAMPGSGTVYAVCPVSNTGGADVEAMLVLALYNAAGKLMGIDTEDSTIKAGESAELRAALDVPGGQNVYAKAYLWDKRTMKPLENAAVLPGQ